VTHIPLGRWHWDAEIKFLKEFFLVWNQVITCVIELNQCHVFGTSSEMLNTLLDFSRIEAGVVEVQAVAFELQPLLNKIEIERAPQADAKGLIYRTREAHDAVLSDPGLVELILRNLVSNAIRYTQQGGVLVGWRTRGQCIQLEVWDTGIGIAPEQQAEVFEEFHQLGNPGRDRSKGLGLGLAIASGLAHRLGTEVTLASRPGRGSVFRLRLPRATDDTVNPPHEPPKGLVVLPGLRVLVIDDDADVRAAMRQLLGSWGCHCQTAETISQALDAARTERPAVVISDWHLRQNETGAQAIAALRAELATCTIDAVGRVSAKRVTRQCGDRIVGLRLRNRIALAPRNVSIYAN